MSPEQAKRVEGCPFDPSTPLPGPPRTNAGAGRIVVSRSNHDVAQGPCAKC